MKFNKKLTFTSTMAVSKVHLLVSNQRADMLAKHHPTTSRNIMNKRYTQSTCWSLYHQNLKIF